MSNQTNSHTTVSTPRRVRVRDLGLVIDGRIRKSWPFGGKPRSVHKTKSLLNPGDQCYRNAVLQCLLHTPEFYRYLDKANRCDTQVDNCVFCAVRALALEYWSHGQDERPQRFLNAAQKTAFVQSRYRALDNVNTAMNNQPVTSYGFLRSHLSDSNNMDISGQHDAHEYFLGLTNMLRDANTDANDRRAHVGVR